MDDRIIEVECIQSYPTWDGGIYGRYLVGSFRPGYAVTIATTLRRAMLSELPGIALTGVDIENVEHEYCTMRGIRESVLDVTSNLKEIVLAGRLPSPSSGRSRRPLFGHLNVTGPTIARGKDIKLPPGLRCVNPEQYIATLTQDGTLRMKVVISAGKDYLRHTSARNKKLWNRHLLPIDANFMPIRKVNFLLRPDHRGKRLREQIILEVWSNGSLDPIEGVRLAAVAIQQLFTPFQTTGFKGLGMSTPLPPLKRERMQPSRDGEKNQPSSRPSRGRPTTQLLSPPNIHRLTDLGYLDLSVKTYTYLRRRNIFNIQQLLLMTSNVRRAMPTEISMELKKVLLTSMWKGVFQGR